MRPAIHLFLILLALLLIAFCPRPLGAQNVGGDILNEAPLNPVPIEMTFEEYQDMNRRLTVGLIMSAIPIPGMIHFYAGEPRTGWKILGAAVGGALAIVAGIASMDEGEFPTSDFEPLIRNEDEDNERRYEMIPFEVVGGETSYRLHELERKREGPGGILIILGAAVIVGDIVYDFVHGVKVIEEKRDRVRFKYGKLLSDVSITPNYNLPGGGTGIKLSWGF